MKMGVLAAVIVLAIAAWLFLSRATFYTKYGTFAVSPEFTLTVSDNAGSHMPTFQIDRTSGGGGWGRDMVVTKPGDPFLLYWDDANKTLWWATSAQLGYCRMEKGHSAASSVHARSEPLQDEDEFPDRPSVFVSEMERTLPVH